MRLTWKEIATGVWEADGTRYSYRVITYKVGGNNLYRAEKERQRGGQVVDANNIASLDGAFARAQTWENAEYLRR